MNASLNQERSPEACRTKTLEAIDAALAHPPRSVERASVEITQCLVALRDALIAARRTQRSARLDRELAHTNAVLSLVHGVQFPLQGVQWDKLKQVREEMAKLSRASTP